MKERKSLGHVMFRVDGGVISTSDVDLFPDPQEAKDCARLIVEACREHDRYANPEHPHYDGTYADQTRQEYEKRFENAKNLCNISLNPDDDYIFLEVFGYVDTGPDFSMIGPVTHAMQAIYARHKETWKGLTADEKNRFLEFFAASQTERSNYDQYHFCLRRGFSYRHILHEMKQRGMPDRSFIKADYSLLLYLEDYDAWEEWSRRQEASLMRESVHKTCSNVDRDFSECGDRNPSISSVP